MKPWPAGPFLLAVILTIGAVSTPALAQTPLGTDIWVFNLTGDQAAVDISSGVRVTNRPGYDNQPHLLPGGRILLFTSIDESGQADILRYEFESGKISHLTETDPESEYSATIMPSQDRVSVIRVEADSAQRLWSFDLSGGNPVVLLPGIAPVGYHAWIDDDRLALFVLGSPATLQIASLSGGTGEIMASDIGRSLHLIPASGRVSFVQWGEGRRGTITEFDPDTGETRGLTPLLAGNEYYAWTPSGVLVMGQGSKLFRRIPGGHEGWTELADLAPAGVDGISRISISPEGDRIAVVGVGE